MQGIIHSIRLPETGIVADVGAGQGTILFELLKTNPNLTGIIFELPAVADLVEEGMKNTDPLSDSVYAKYSANVKQRVSIVEGNYMDVTHLRQTVDPRRLLLQMDLPQQQ